MPTTLDSAFLKLRRAKHHLEVVRVEIDRIEQDNLYEAFRDEDPDGLHYRLVARNVKGLDPYLATIIGDCVHNYRAALTTPSLNSAPGPMTRTRPSPSRCSSNATSSTPAPGRVPLPGAVASTRFARFPGRPSSHRAGAAIRPTLVPALPRLPPTLAPALPQQHRQTPAPSSVRPEVASVTTPEEPCPAGGGQCCTEPAP